MRLTEECLKINSAEVAEKIRKFIKSSVEKAKAKGTVIGLSGGLDSLTVATLCVSALGKEGVIALIMPSSTTCSEETEDAKLMAQKLDVKYETVDITSLEEKFFEACNHHNPKDIAAKGNVKPRIRMTLLYYHANLLNRIVVGTGNKSELLTGYYTKYGDGGVDILPIGDLYKTQVRQLAAYLKISKRIIEKTPTAGLWPGQTDEDELGMKYNDLDLVLHGLVDLQMKPDEIVKQTDLTIQAVDRVASLVCESEHKRNMPPILKIKG